MFSWCFFGLLLRCSLFSLPTKYFLVVVFLHLFFLGFFKQMGKWLVQVRRTTSLSPAMRPIKPKTVVFQLDILFDPWQNESTSPNWYPSEHPISASKIDYKKTLNTAMSTTKNHQNLES